MIQMQSTAFRLSIHKKYLYSLITTRWNRYLAFKDCNTPKVHYSVTWILKSKRFNFVAEADSRILDLTNVRIDDHIHWQYQFTNNNMILEHLSLCQHVWTMMRELDLFIYLFNVSITGHSLAHINRGIGNLIVVGTSW